jgi:SAM-dependent methyltransferase
VKILESLVIMPNAIVKVGHKVLALPVCYDLFQTAVGSVRFRSNFVTENIGNFRADNVLDLGCGTASTSNLLPENVSYIGLDTSSKYLEKASKRTANRDSKLILTDIADNTWTQSAGKLNSTLGLALGIYHHISDEQLEETIFNVASVVAPGSKLVSLDPVIDSKTTKLAKWFARNDRGQYIREPEMYAETFKKYGFSIKYEITRNSFRIPYDLILITATKEK